MEDKFDQSRTWCQKSRCFVRLRLDEANQGSSESRSVPSTDTYSNPDHPYFISQSDHPGAVLVKTALSTDNYGN
ncbi:hypothetical protein SADUNF_Sadunf04G0083400 [Salix dunnii]|uniref:Uncharacterized protein n=1 Tax=Salix dunnii TaxID=1413687 RepID=A0A835K4K2_9ROSI|nr:hypothetical protein SADUNF_Sadunf04G0083400 [Salix dunnii]